MTVIILLQIRILQHTKTSQFSLWPLLALKYVQSQINIDIRITAFVSDLKSYLSSYHLYAAKS